MTDKNPRAFPLSVNDIGDSGYDGMGLREYYKAHALPIAYAMAIRDNDYYAEADHQKGEANPREVAILAGQIADEMLAEDARSGGKNA